MGFNHEVVKSFLEEHEQELIQVLFKHKLMLSKSKYQCQCILWCRSLNSILVSHFKKDVDNISVSLWEEMTVRVDAREDRCDQVLKGCHAEEEATYFHSFISLTNI